MALLTEGVFALLFARALWAYLARREALAREVALLFSVMAAVFVLDLLQLAVGPSPWLGRVAAVLVMALPPLTLRLLRQMRPVGTRVYWAAWAAWLVIAALLMISGGTISLVVRVAGALYFLTVEALAATLLWRSARVRTGTSRVRLRLASAATWLFAAAVVAQVVMTGVAGDDGQPVGSASAAAAALGLLSAIGYLLAFHPPRWLRGIWSTRAGLTLIRRLLPAPADQQPDELRQGYVDTVCQVTGADAVMLWAGPGADQLAPVAECGLPPGPTFAPPPGPTELAVSGRRLPSVDRPAGGCPPWLSASARRAGAQFVTTVPIEVSSGAATLVLLNRFRSLFTADDAALLGGLGTQVQALVERQRLLVERRQLGEQLAESLEAMRAAAQAKSDFLASMSHELRTPLNAIIGFSDLMATEQAEGDRIGVPAEWVGHINSSGRHLLGLINDVLDLAKVEAGRVDLHRELLELGTVVDDAVSALRSLSDDKRQEVTVAVAPLRIRADPLRFRQILTNLLSNAIKFTPQEGRIYVTARRVGHEVVLSVADTGPGIPPEDQERVFEEFQQAAAGRSARSGTGLGLALTLRLVQAHGGRVELESDLGRGSKFSVYLPAADQPDEPTPGTTEPVGAAAGDRPGVLVIEDDPATASLLATYLEGAGYHVDVAASGEEGVEKARGGHIEAVLLDVLLPGIDGWEVLRRLKRDERLRQIPVLIISVLEEQQVGLALGAADYFVKPVDRQTLVSWLARGGLIPPLGGPEVRVLAIDDDPASLRLVEESLRHPGIMVLTAPDGVTGLRLAREASVDLIICDLVMPGLDGFDVIAALHDDPRTRDIPVVVLSAHDLTDADKERLTGKVRTVVAKAPDTARLEVVVAEVSRATGMQRPTPVG